jgi:hypothetical protein
VHTLFLLELVSILNLSSTVIKSSTFFLAVKSHTHLSLKLKELSLSVTGIKVLDFRQLLV